MSLHRCAACGSPNVVVDTQKEGYSIMKGAAGMAAVGPIGAVVGLDGKKTTVYKCPDCGVTLSYEMPDSIRETIDLAAACKELTPYLKLDGAPISAAALQARYKNCGIRISTEAASGAGRGMTSSGNIGQDMETAVMLNKATATQEDFDTAVDLLIDFERRIYSTPRRQPDAICKESPLTYEEYLKWTSAIELFIENCFVYIPPNTNRFLKYRGAEIQYFISFYFYDYIGLAYQKLRNGKVLNKDDKKDCEDFNKFWKRNIFIRTFLKKYSNFFVISSYEQRDMDKGDYVSWSVEGISKFSKLFCRVFTEIHKVYFDLLIPLYWAQDSELKANQLTYNDAYVHSGDDLLNPYFEKNPGEKERIENEFKNINEKSERVDASRIKAGRDIKELEKKIADEKEDQKRLEKKLIKTAKVKREISAQATHLAELNNNLSAARTALDEAEAKIGEEEKEAAALLKENNHFLIWE